MTATLSILEALKELDATKEIVPRSDPTSEARQNWLSRAIALLRQVEPGGAAAFETRASILGRRLSAERLSAAWYDMTLILKTAINDLELKTVGVDERVYAPGEAYNLFQDLRDAIGGAATSVFVIDPYADEEVFDLYFQNCAPGVKIRLLIRESNAERLRPVMTKFRSLPGVQFQARVSGEIHDRLIFRDDACWVIGTSIGPRAATTKPTYLIAVHNIKAMRAPYEYIWSRATPV